MSTSPEYMGYNLEAFVGAFTPICIIATALRFYARSLVIKRYDAGDWLIIAALFGQLVAGGLAVGAVRQGGLGHHTNYLQETEPGKFTILLKYIVAISAWYAATEGLAKIAVCLLYKRIFFAQKRLLIIIYMTMGIIIGSSISVGFAYLFGCSPFSAHWGSSEEQQNNCLDMDALTFWTTLPNIITDVVLLAVPIATVWKLRASLGMRVGLVLTFLCGSIGMITSILRFTAFYDAFYTKNYFEDPTWYSVTLIIWTVCEPGMYLIAACFLVYRPLLNKMGISDFITGVTNHGKIGARLEDGQEMGNASELGLRGTEGKAFALHSIGGTPFSGGAPYGDGVVSSKKPHYGSAGVGGSFRRSIDGDDRLLKNMDSITATTDIEIPWEARHGLHALEK